MQTNMNIYTFTARTFGCSTALTSTAAKLPTPAAVFRCVDVCGKGGWGWEGGVFMCSHVYLWAGLFFVCVYTHRLTHILCFCIYMYIYFWIYTYVYVYVFVHMHMYRYIHFQSIIYRQHQLTTWGCSCRIVRS